MKIVRTSMVTGKTHEMDLDITHEEIKNYERGALLQDAFPHLTPDEREFYKTGITAEEWATTFSDEEEF